MLEGIYLFKREYQEYFDVRIWIDCSFETALARAIARAQEGLPSEETVSAHRTIYFPAQEIHFERDALRASAHVVLRNDEPSTSSPLAANRPTRSASRLETSRTRLSSARDSVGTLAVPADSVAVSR